jgi:hypothetical protein
VCSSDLAPICVMHALCVLLHQEVRSIIRGVRTLHLNSDTTRTRINAITTVTPELSMLLGAFAADGYLQKEKNGSYRLKICDGERESVQKAAEWVQSVFGAKPILRYDINDHTWTCWFNSKIIARCLEAYFEFRPGIKSRTTRIPTIIRHQEHLRRAFVAGVLTFDGGIKKTGMVAFSTRSRHLFGDVVETIENDGIKLKKGYNEKKDFWFLESVSGRKKDELKKWLQYFVQGTLKRERLEFFINERSYSIAEAERLFPPHYKGRVSIRSVHQAALEMNSLNPNILQHHPLLEGVARNTLYKYVFILKKTAWT